MESPKVMLLRETMKTIERSVASLPIGIFEADPDCRVTAANDAYRQLVLDNGPLVTGSAPWVNAAPIERTAAEVAWRRAIDAGQDFVHTFRLLAVGDREVWVQISTQPVKNANGEIIGYVGSAQNSSAVATQHTLADQLVNLLDASSDAVLVFTPQGRLMFSNNGARTLFGEDEELADRFIQTVRDQVPREVLSGLSGEPWEGEVGFRGIDGIVRTLSAAVQVHRNDDGTISHLAVIARDITETRQLQDELTRQATHDALTGLPNRVLFLRKLAEALDHDRTNRRGVAVMFVDFDNLKHVNDSIGHAIGDHLLTNVAKRLVNATRPSDLVARIGGDEFVILCEGINDEHVAMEVAERIRQSVTGQLVLQGMDVYTSASIGIAMASAELLESQTPPDAAATLLSNADTAMYRAKQRGRGRCEMFTEQMRTVARERLMLASSLERALANNEFALMMMPIVSTHTGRISGAEALLRWNHSERGQLTPTAFLELADESGLIGPIGDWVVDQTSALLRRLLDSDTVERSFTVSVNISSRQLADTSLPERMLATVKRHGLDASQFVLDITETTLMDENPSVMRSLQSLQRAGFRIAFDDFGTGYSSLTNLRTVTADHLKLDASLVRDIGQHGGDDPVVRSIILLAHSLHMAVVAEWVTTEEQVQRLRLLGCDYMQGHRIGVPTAVADFESALRAREFDRRRA